MVLYLVEVKKVFKLFFDYFHNLMNFSRLIFVRIQIGYDIEKKRQILDLKTIIDHESQLRQLSLKQTITTVGQKIGRGARKQIMRRLLKGFYIICRSKK